MRRAFTLMCLLAVPGTALAADEVSSWQAGANASYAFAGDLSGFAVAVTGLWNASEYFAFGATIDLARLGMSGDRALNGRSFRYGTLSSFIGGIAVARLPIGAVTPYADLAIGGVLVSELYSENVQCSYGSGIDGSIGGGVKLNLGRSIALGLRASARLPGGTMSCNDALGPANFDLAPLISLGASADLRF